MRKLKNQKILVYLKVHDIWAKQRKTQYIYIDI